MGVLPDKFSYGPTPYCAVVLVFQYGQNEKKDKVAKDCAPTPSVNVHINMIVTMYARKMAQIQVKPCNTSVDAQSETRRKRCHKQGLFLEA